MRILDRSLVSLVGFDGLIGDVGEGVAVGHSREVGFDRANNTERTIADVAQLHAQIGLLQGQLATARRGIARVAHASPVSPTRSFCADPVKVY